MRGPANATPTSEPVIAPSLPLGSCARVPGTFVRRTPRSLVILVAGSQLPVRISGSAVDVWEMLAIPRSTDSLLSEWSTRDDTRADRAVEDLGAALAVLVEAGAVVVA
jgi:hypothetical protein